MKKMRVLLLSILLFLPLFSSALELEDKENIVSLKLTEETVIAPKSQLLEIVISKPLLYTPKKFELTLSIIGPAFFDNGKKTENLKYDSIDDTIQLNKIINIDSSASAQGEIITINYQFKYKSSSLGKIDEDFKEFEGNISFRGVSSGNALIEEQLKDCSNDKSDLKNQLDLQNEKINSVDALEQSLKSCQDELDAKSNIKYILISSAAIILMLLFLFLWIKEKFS